MTEVRQIAHNTLIQTMGKAITITLGLVAFGLITRALGQEGFGYFTTVYAFLSIFGILIDLGLQMTTTKLISDPRENENQILSNALTIRLIASIVFLGLAPLVVLFFPYPQIIKFGVAVAAIGFIFNSLTATLTSLFQKHLAMYLTVFADVVAKIIYIILLLIALHRGWGLIGIIGATVFDGLATLTVLYLMSKRYARLSWQFDFAIWRKILVATWPIALTIALNLIYFKGDLVIMSLLRPQTEVGLYGAPYRVLEVLINAVYLFLGLILPLLATAVAIKNLDRLKNILQSVFDFLIIVGLPLVVGGYFVGQGVMVFIAGPDFALSGEIMKILLIATAAIFIAALFGYAVVALNQQKRMIKFYALNAVVSITAYLIFIPRYTYWAAAWITVLSEIFILLTAYWVLYKTIGFRPQLKIIIKSLLASAVMALPLYFWQQLNFVWLIPIGLVVYFIALYALKGFSKKMLREILTLKSS